MGKIASRPERKEKKSFTLSLSSVQLLEEMRKKSSAESTSAVLEDILQAVRRKKKRAAIDRAMTEYYDSLTESESEEQRMWGEFAFHQLSHED